MKHRFPIFLKVIFLGIAVSILTAGTAITVSYFNHKKSNEANLINNIDNSLDEVEYLFNGSREHSDYLADLDSVKTYIEEIYNADPDHKKMDDFNTFDEYLDYYETLYPWIYPNQGGVIGLSKEMLEFKNAYYRVTSVLTNAQISSGCRAAYMAYLDDGNNLVMLSDSRINKPDPNDSFFQVPGSYYKIKDSDYYIDEQYTRHSGLMLSGYRTRYAKVFDINISGEKLDSTMAYVFIEYDLNSANETAYNIFLQELLVLGLSSLTLVLVYALFSYWFFARNISKLSTASEEIRKNLVEKKMDKITEVNVKAHDEIRALADSFNEMSREIVNYTAIIEQETLEKEKINAELDVASKIQLDALPSRNFDDGNVSIRAFIKTAKEVGGDFYDYLYLDDHRIAITISDVSGKGIPASLFMMKGKELIRSAVQTHATLVEAIKYVNTALARNNKELLFITSFIGIIDIEKHELKYINAGHEKPYIISNGKIIKLEGESNIPLGIDDTYVFVEGSHVFNKGDRLFMFTDGLNESINDKQEEFGYQRVEECLTNNASSSPDEVINKIIEGVNGFVACEEQFDDLTLLMIKENDGKLSLHYEKKDYSIIEDATDKFHANYPYLPAETKGSAGIILDEIINNLISYEKREDLVIDVNFQTTKKGLEIVVSSNGEDYDPFVNHKQKYLEKFDNDIEEGGFGTSLIKELSKSHSYEYKDGRSIIKVVL